MGISWGSSQYKGPLLIFYESTHSFTPFSARDNFKHFPYHVASHHKPCLNFIHTASHGTHSSTARPHARFSSKSQNGRIQAWPLHAFENQSNHFNSAVLEIFFLQADRKHSVKASNSSTQQCCVSMINMSGAWAWPPILRRGLC